MSIALRPCPFCGSPAEFGEVEDRDSPDFGGHFVQCTNEGCHGCMGIRFACGDDPQPGLAAAWNRRPQAMIDTPSEAVAKEVLRERKRQITAEGFGRLHDNRHVHHELAGAAACYALGSKLNWPATWDDRWWKPSPDRRRNLVKAAALLVAEIERIDRMEG